MSRRLAFLLLLASCSDTGATTGGGLPDAKSSTCTATSECSAGSWCNPQTTLCEPRASSFTFEDDIFPTLQATCAGCHVAGVADSQGGDIVDLSGNDAAAYASLTSAGTNCGSTVHHLCVDEPRKSEVIARLVTHAAATGSGLLVPTGVRDPFVQRLLHWIAAGAPRAIRAPDAAVSRFDAPIVPDSPLPRPDARTGIDAGRDLTPPTGGNVIAASVTGCTDGSLTIQPATDDTTPADQIEYQVCVGSTMTSCQVNFTPIATFDSPGDHVIDLSSHVGATVFLAGRAVDLAGNGNTPTEVHSVSVTAALNWPAGSVTLTKIAAPGTYSVTYPAVSSSCATAAPLTVTATCSGGGGCSCAVAADQQSATCTATSCEAIAVNVHAVAGNTMDTRSASYTVQFEEVSPMFDHNGCRGCHTGDNPFGPTFSRADINRPASVHCSSAFKYIVPLQPMASMIWGVASSHHFLCDPAGTNAHTFNAQPTQQEIDTLVCWIDGGAL